MWIWLAYSAIVVILDQITKLLIQNQIALGSGLSVNSFFNVVHVHNPGAAFSFLAAAAGWQKPVLIGVAAVAIVVVLYLLFKHRSQRRLVRIRWREHERRNHQLRVQLLRPGAQAGVCGPGEQRQEGYQRQHHS